MQPIIITALIVVGLVAGVGAVAGQQQPGEPVNLYGSIEEGDGTPAPEGTTLFAIVDGEEEGSITVSPPGQYGGPETFDDALTVNTGAGDEVVFRVFSTNGPQSIETFDLSDSGSGRQEFDLTFPDGTFTDEPTPPNFEVNITDTPAEVTEGDDVIVEYQVENTGGQSGTQDIEFLVDGTVESTQTVTLTDGELRSDSFTYTTVTGDAPELTTEVRSEDDTDTATVAVDQSGSASAFFDVSITNAPDTVPAGDTITVEYQVENTGGQSGTQDIEFLVDGTVESTQTVTLTDGELRSDSFTYTTVTGDAPELTTEVRSANDTDTATVPVNESPPNFEVDITDTPAEVTEGDDVTVEYQVENTGGQSGTQDIEFLVDGTVESTQTVTLTDGELRSDSFTYTTVTGDAPELTTEVRSADDTDTATVAVDQSGSASAFFDVSITNAPDTVPAGDTITVEYQVENTGGQSGTQDIEFLVDGTVESTQTVTLTDGELRSDSFTYTTVTGDAPELTTEVRSANDTDTATVPVNESPPNFEVDITDTPAEVTEGDDVTVEYQVENTGGQSGTQAIEFVVDGTVESTQTVTLTDGELRSDSFTYTTVTGDAPELTTEVRSANDTDTATVPVNESPPNFEVDITDTPAEVTEGDDVTVEYQVENTGGQSGTQAIEFLVNGTVESTQTVTLTDGELRSDSFTYTTVRGDAPELTAEVRSANDTDTATVPVNESPPNFEVNITDTPAEVTEGDDVTVEYQVENTGGQSGTQAIEFLVDGTVESTQTVTLTDGELRSDSFTYTTVKGDAPELTAEVRSANDTDTATVAINESGPLEVTLSNLSIAGEGEDVTVLTEAYDVSVELSYDSGLNGTVPLELSIGDATTTTTVPLNVSETKTVTFESATDGLSTGIYDVTVSAVNASVTGEVTLSVDVDGNGEPATDTTGNGLLNDVNGDESFNIFDIQALFSNLETDPVQNNPGLFNFNGDDNPDEVTIFDVQELFIQLN